jgi:hypothetical protein
LASCLDPGLRHGDGIQTYSGRINNPESIEQVSQLRWFSYGLVLVAIAAMVLFSWPKLAANLFATGVSGQSFMPHGMCYLWVPQLWWLHLSTDLLIGLSYVCILATLVYLIHRARRDIPFSWIFLAFGLFIIACAVTHFMGAWTIWNASYWLSGYTKLLTAVVSVATALVLPLQVPKVLSLVEAVKLSEQRKTQLEAAHIELAEARDAALEERRGSNRNSSPTCRMSCARRSTPSSATAKS